MGKIITNPTLKNVANELKKYNNLLTELYGDLENLSTTDKSNLINAINELYMLSRKENPFLELEYVHDIREYILCRYKGNGNLSVSSSDTSIADVELSNNNVINITRHNVGTPTITVDIEETDTHFSDRVSIIIPKGLRFGYRIKESESDPYARVEYLYDAEDMTPAKMLTSGTFDYGDWENAWFIKDNKPLMLNSDGTVAYYLNPNNYSLKEDGTSSDVANTSFDGNAMAQMPLVWIKRYSENGYHYEIVSNVQYDSDYKAYAHTRMNGTIAPYFYYSMYGGVNISNKLRSLSGQSLAQNLTATNAISYAIANGSNWYIHTWSQREYIRTLLTLIGKSTNSQAVFGNGNCSGNNTMLSTGTLNDKGQFYGNLTATNVQVKCLHVEKFWGDQFDWTAGILNNGNIHVKMTREGSGYQIDNVNGYINTNITLSNVSSSYIVQCVCNEYGMIPTAVNGSESTYYTDAHWFSTSSFSFLSSGGSAYHGKGVSGAWTFAVCNPPTSAYIDHSAALSCEMPPT